MKFEFSEKSSNLKLMKITPVRADMLHADRQTDRHDESNSRFSQVCERALKVAWSISDIILEY
jgi:hypothetical protein